MSCNGCRALRRGCSESCILRPCLEWIDGAPAQSNATLFVSKFFGRSDLMAFISAVPHNKRPALFQSLLFEACGRTVNPVNGAVGLLSTGNWHLCQAAVEAVLAGGAVCAPVTGIHPPGSGEASRTIRTAAWDFQNQYAESEPSMSGSDQVAASQPFSMFPPPFISAGRGRRGRNYLPDKVIRPTASFVSDLSDVSMSLIHDDGVGGEEPKLLNLLV